ncbi:MAG: septum formation initiator family protein [Acidobacteria bacterium]|nr:septum formation initiator family protein [Acidobacteriota bacterium]
MSFLIRQLGYVAVAAVACFYVFVALRGPNGIPTMMEKRRQIEHLKLENDALRQEIDRRKVAIEQLQTSDDARRRAVREQTRKAMEGDITVYLPEPSTDSQH